MTDSIKTSIDSKKRLWIDYPPGRRLIEPHVLGFSRASSKLLRAFQVEGASSSGEHENWKLFTVDKVQGIEDSGQTFNGPRPGYNPDDSAMKGGIISRL